MFTLQEKSMQPNSSFEVKARVFNLIHILHVKFEHARPCKTMLLCSCKCSINNCGKEGYLFIHLSEIQNLFNCTFTNKSINFYIMTLSNTENPKQKI